MDIARGKHIVAVNAIDGLGTYIERERIAVANKATLRARYEEGKHSIYIATVPDLSNLRTQVSIQVGIIAHLLRSSLDNLAFYLACRNTRGRVRNPRDIYFPITDSEEAFAKTSARTLSELSETDRRTIGEYQPFNRNVGRPDSYSGPYIHQLSLLRDISNQDKHRETVEVLVDPNQFQFNRAAAPICEAWNSWVNKQPEEYIQSYEPPVMRVGEVIQGAVANIPFKEDEFEAGFALAEFSLVGRRPTIPTLRRLSSYVGLIHDQFDEV